MWPAVSPQHLKRIPDGLCFQAATKAITTSFSIQDNQFCNQPPDVTPQAYSTSGAYSNMNSTAQRILLRWHRSLHLQKQEPSWYRDRLREELYERRQAKTPCQKLSETADVFYIISRSHHDGYPLRHLPSFAFSHLLVYAYLLPKYTLRWKFYRSAAYLCGSPNPGLVQEVVNPAKDHKLHEVVSRHGIDPETFTRVFRRLQYFWPLLP
ncbi:hypothetical protein CDV31_005949 [Fusarium ambrosium]|uniref:Uncharacterized protein n=1 Tax=Fusarium ambrosium TaxID=131363 RepID=A0A428UG27_9HYPO|nr:hypothetical protein CDV31_005949 [Fusarium ambrosium]